MQDVKMTDHQNCRAWNCRTWNWRTNVQGMKLQDMKRTDQIAGHEIARHEIKRQEIAGHENAGHENARHENDLPKMTTGREMAGEKSTSLWTFTQLTHFSEQTNTLRWTVLFDSGVSEMKPAASHTVTVTSPKAWQNAATDIMHLFKIGHGGRWRKLLPSNMNEVRRN